MVKSCLGKWENGFKNWHKMGHVAPSDWLFFYTCDTWHHLEQATAIDLRVGDQTERVRRVWQAVSASGVVGFRAADAGRDAWRGD